MQPDKATRKVFDLLLKRGKINQSLVTQMLGWKHSGRSIHFSAHAAGAP